MHHAFRFLATNHHFIDENNFVGARLKDINSLVELLLPLLYLGGTVIFGAMLIMAAYQIITAGGDPEKVAKGRQTITFAVIGILVIFLAYLMVQILAFVTGLNNNPL